MSDPKLKLDHARGHLDRLQSELVEFERFRPFQHVRDWDEEGVAYVYRAQVNREPPPAVGLLIGDVLHNIRSALDHLVWELDDRDADLKRETEFPIFLEQERYQKGALRKVAGLSADAQSIVENFQPYHSPTPDLHLLWVLHALNNLDKHRTIAVVVGQTRAPLTVTRHSEDELEIGYANVQFVAGEEILRIAVDDVERQRQFEDYATFRLAFDQGEPGRGAGVTEGLGQIYEYVAGVVFPALT